VRTSRTSNLFWNKEKGKFREKFQGKALKKGKFEQKALLTSKINTLIA
jgi:hypothetical protein